MFMPPHEHPNERAVPVAGFWDAFKFWLKLGFISFGGPAGQIAVMHTELVERRRWISERRFLHALNYCMVLPGPEAQQLATYIGWLLHRTWGGIVAGALFVLPSLVILIALSWAYLVYGDTLWMSGIFYGIKPAVTAIVVHAAYRIGSRVLKNAWLWSIAAAAFVALFALKAPFPLIIVGAALVGYIGGRIAPAKFSQQSTHKKEPDGVSSAVIDDHSPPPAHARFSWSRLSIVLIAGLVLWLTPLLALTLHFTWQGTLPQMSWFFTKAALLTFGGAYAVLPYVYQGAVTNYAWLTPTQMIDGLALGETTPGPLIMVVVFVAFVGGFTLAPLGPDMTLASGILAALVVTWSTFLPSFIFIFAGGPLVESTRNELRLTASLTAITAAVVGVIANLAMFFAYHVFWPTSTGGVSLAGIDWIAVAIALAAAIALIRFNRNVLEVIGACGAIGLVVQTLI